MNHALRSTLRTLAIIVAAAAVLAAVIYSYVYVNEKPPAATGYLVKVTVSPIHSEMRMGTPAQGLVGGVESYDQLVVMADVEIHNQSKSPVHIEDMWGDLTLDNGKQQRSLAAPKEVFEKVFVAYPQLTHADLPPVLRDATIQPGQTVRGAMIFNYPITQKDWDSRQKFVVAISFTHQSNLVLRAPR